MSNIAYVYALVIVAAVAVFFGVQWYRRLQARRTADRLGGQVPANGPAAGAWQPPVSVPSVGGQAVQLQVLGHPAVAWQSGGLGDSEHGVRLSLLVDYGAGLPMLTMFHYSQVAQVLLDHVATATGIDALDRSFRSSGELDVWRPVLGSPTVQQALLSFPLNSVFVLGGRITLESLDGVHLEPRAAEGLVAVATALVSAIPATAAGSVTPGAGPDPADAEAIVRTSLSRSGMSPEQQDAMLQLIRATEARRGGR